MKKTITIIHLLIYLVSFQVQAQEPQLAQACTGSRVRYSVSGWPQSVFNWEIQGGKILQFYNDSVDVQWNSTPSTGIVKVTEHTVTNCMGSPVYAYIVVSSPGKLALTEPAAICEGETSEIIGPENYVSYLWNKGGTSKNITGSTQGWYKLEAWDNAGCVTTDSVYLTVNKHPYVYLGNDTFVCDNPLQLTAGDESNFYQWSTGAITSSVTVGNGKQTIWVKVTNSDTRCSNSDTINIRPCKTDLGGIPNAFTPNGDGDNDKWVIDVLLNYPDARVDVYDRWGRLVFRSTNGLANGWDGTSRSKPLPMDSYYYIINLNDGSEPKAGTVTIIR